MTIGEQILTEFCKNDTERLDLEKHINWFSKNGYNDLLSEVENSKDYNNMSKK